MGTTSISVNPLTLKWANKMKAYYEYNWGRKVGLDEALLQVCSMVDWMIAKDVLKSTDLDYLPFCKEQLEKFKPSISAKDFNEALETMSKWSTPEETDK